MEGPARRKSMLLFLTYRVSSPLSSLCRTSFMLWIRRELGRERDSQRLGWPGSLEEVELGKRVGGAGK